MAQNVNPTFVKTPNRGVALISTGTGTSSVTLYTGGANGSKIVGVTANNGSTSALTVNLYLVNSANNYYLSTTSLSASNVPTSLLPSTTGLPVDSDGNAYVLLASSADTLAAASQATVPTASAFITLVAMAGDF